MSKDERSPLVILGLDTGDPEFIRRWAQEGYLPTIASIMERGTWGRTSGPELISEHGVWRSLFSGLSRSQHGYYYYRQLIPGSYDLEETVGPDIDSPPFWRHLRGQDVRVATVDVPDTDPVPGLPGLQLAHWGTHNNWNPDRLRPASTPPELLDEVQKRFGDQLVTREKHESSFEEDCQIYQQVMRRVETKGAACRHILTQENFDLMVAVFGESHVANHQFWSHHPDNAAPSTSENELTHAIRDVYQAVDQEMGKLLDELPEDANVFVVSSVGMKDDYPITGFTEAFLRKLGYQATPEADGLSLHPMDLARQVIPESWRAELSKRLLPRETREKLLAQQFRNGKDWSRTRAFSIPSPYTSFIRVNLRGREPEGIVEPGPEYRALLNELETELKNITDPVTNEPAVTQVWRTKELFEGDVHDALPDLFADWRPGRFMQRVVHPEAELTQDKPEFYRRSDHSAYGFVAGAGPDVGQSGQDGEFEVLDLAPTFLSLMDTSVPEEMSGEVLESFARAE